jgi:hypothetical protein
MISKLMGLAMILHGLEMANVNNLQSQALLLTGALLIICSVKWQERRLRETVNAA